jgi:YegS/Rv2252/BmrU family lipid kinase
MSKTNKWCFIINPAAGAGRVAKQWANIEAALLEAEINFEVLYSEQKMHATELAKKAVENGSRHIIAVGGDGTAHEIINGIFLQNVCPTENITFCLLPIGTGNDWVKTHHIPKKFQEWLTVFKNGKTVFQDIGFIVFQKNKKTEKRYFINVAGLSYDGYVAKKSEGAKATFFNSLFYLEMMARCLINFRVPKLSVLFDGENKRGELFTVNIGICRYSGGGMQLVPHALPNDGLLALTLAGKINPFVVLLVSPLFYLGKIGWHPKVNFFQTKKIKIEPLDDEPIWVEADGEFLGEAPVEVGILPGSLKIIVP